MRRIRSSRLLALSAHTSPSEEPAVEAPQKLGSFHVARDQRNFAVTAFLEIGPPTVCKRERPVGGWTSDIQKNRRQGRAWSITDASVSLASSDERSGWPEWPRLRASPTVACSARPTAPIAQG